MRTQEHSWRLEFRAGAQRALEGLAQRNPHIASKLIKKIQWLKENVGSIRHEKLRGCEEYSLHCGQYRVLYELDWTQRRIVIVRVGAHNAAYRR